MNREDIAERLHERRGWLANPDNSASPSYAAVAADARELERLLLEAESNKKEHLNNL